MKNVVIGIAGGSGSGKSTLAVALCRKYPDKIIVLHIDDYFKKKEETPVLGKFTNWDHPDSINFDNLLKDITALKNNEEINILTKSELYNPDYNHILKNKIEVKIKPKPIIIIEGYLVLWNEQLRKLLDYKIYLDIPINDSIKRRSENKFFLNEEYFEKVLLPMHNLYVAPKSQYAELVLNVSKMTPDDVTRKIENEVFKN